MFLYLALSIHSPGKVKSESRKICRLLRVCQDEGEYVDFGVIL